MECSLTLTSPLKFLAIGMQDDRLKDHANQNAGQAQTNHECDDGNIHTSAFFVLAVAMTTTTTEQQATENEADQAQGYQKPEIDL